MANPYVFDFSPVNNALAGWQKKNQFNEQMGMKQQQFEATNALAQGQFGLQKQAADRAAAEAARMDQTRGAVTNYLAGGQGFEGIPQPLVELSRIQGDASPVQAYLLAEAKRKAAQSGPEEYGKAGAVFQDPTTGEFKAIQFGGKGTLKTHPLTGMRPAKGVKQVGDELVDVGSGDTVRNVAPQIANKETAEKVGSARGEFIATFPKSAMAIESLNAKKDIVQTEIAAAKKKLGSSSTGVAGAVLKLVPGTQAFALKENIKTILANVGFEELNQMRAESPTGGALGQVAVQELVYLQAVRGSLEQARTADELRDVLERLGRFQSGAVDRRQRAIESQIKQLGLTRGAGGEVGMPDAPVLDKFQGRPPQGGAAPAPVVRRRFNPETGELE
jgi:hypothetical protein